MWTGLRTVYWNEDLEGAEEWVKETDTVRRFLSPTLCVYPRRSKPRSEPNL